MAAERAFLTAEWRHLVMLNYHVDPAILQPRVPAGTVLDEWQGNTYVSMVGFMFERTKVRGITIPFHVNFEEINLRFYVRREVEGEVRRGVVFVKEIVPKRMIALVARTVYNENYVALPTRNRRVLPGTENGARGSVTYEWQNGGRWHRLAATIQGEPSLAPLDSEEAFITEHYWGYAGQRDGGTVEYQVEHPRWNVWKALDSEFDCDVSLMYGNEFAQALSQPPVSAFVADGSVVSVRQGSRL